MNTSRRSFFKKGLLAVAALPLVKSTKALGAVACPQPAPKDAKVVKKLLEEGSSTAKRLNYVADASKSDHKLHKDGMHCGNCNFYQNKKEVENYAPCSMAAMKFVPSCGWCKSYRKDPKKA